MKQISRRIRRAHPQPPPCVDIAGCDAVEFGSERGPTNLGLPLVTVTALTISTLIVCHVPQCHLSRP